MHRLGLPTLLALLALLAPSADAQMTPRTNERVYLACSRGEMASCDELGRRAHVQGPGQASSEYARLTRYFRERCPHEGERDMQACYHLGELYEHGWGFPPYPERALRLYEDACEQGVAAACGAMAGLVAEGVRGEPPNPALALDRARRGCQQGSPSACHFVALALHAGEMLQRDTARATRMLYENCFERHYAFSCNEYGAARYRGPNRDHTAARRAFGQACDMGYRQACLNLGKMVRRGEGGQPDQRRGRSLIQRACTGARPPRDCEDLEALLR